jgi:hypothetical protein
LCPLIPIDGTLSYLPLSVGPSGHVGQSFHHVHFVAMVYFYLLKLVLKILNH